MRPKVILKKNYWKIKQNYCKFIIFSSTYRKKELLKLLQKLKSQRILLTEESTATITLTKESTKVPKEWLKR